jgi:hypothetical protein
VSVSGAELSVRSFAPGDEQAWEAFCADAYQATFLHSRRFLCYHGDRFVDRSLVLERNGNIEALLPAAQHPIEPDCVVSHPGITYGGLVHDHRLMGQHAVSGLQLAAAHFRGLGYRRFVYKAVPHMYQRVPAQDDLYALFRAGARRVRCDLSSTIDLVNRRAVASRRRRGFAKASKAGVSVAATSDHSNLRALWQVLEQNLANKHGTRPVHTLAEITLLIERFPDNILVLVAQLDGRVVAGIVLFVTPVVWHAQYIASDELGRKTCALDALFEHAIARAAGARARWFDFGISNEQNGQVLNEGLYEFKTEFGGGGMVHEVYELAL